MQGWHLNHSKPCPQIRAWPDSTLGSTPLLSGHRIRGLHISIISLNSFMLLLQVLIFFEPQNPTYRMRIIPSRVVAGQHYSSSGKWPSLSHTGKPQAILVAATGMWLIQDVKLWRENREQASESTQLPAMSAESLEDSEKSWLCWVDSFVTVAKPSVSWLVKYRKEWLV